MNIKLLAMLLILCVLFISYYNIYKKYKIKQQSRNCDKNLWIIDNFFSKDKFQYIKDYFSKLEVKDDPRSNDRKTLCINPVEHEIIYDYIYKNENFLNFVHKIKNPNHSIKKKTILSN